MFLSTVEPTNEKGEPFDPVRSMSNDLVFNTIMTRARSLIYCVGNPFTLCQIGQKYPVNCWKSYLQRCVQCETLQFALPEKRASNEEVEIVTRELQTMVFPHTVISEATNASLKESTADKIINQYVQKLCQRKEYKIGCRLVRKPGGDMDWVGDDDDTSDDVVLCRLEYTFHNKARAVPLDSSQPAIPIRGHANLRGSLQGDTVKIDTKKKRVLFDEKTERAIKQTHFGSTFLCRVHEFNCIQFYPLDKCYPKLINLPTITKEEKRGVVCFDPSSINDTPRVCTIIPHEVALQMVFVVKFLGWKKRCGYPLGIIIGAFPSQSPHFQELMLRMNHSVTGEAIDYPDEEVSEEDITQACQNFPLAITIDPEGSTDHDDALTCTVKERGSRKIYKVGVHITNLQSVVRCGGRIDEQAKQRGCTVYNAPDSISSPMFPARVLKEGSILPRKRVNSFSVLTDFIVTNEGSQNESIQVGGLCISESTVTSEAELTYKEAQDLLFGDEQSYTQSFRAKMVTYDSYNPEFTLKNLVKVLWKFALFLRRKRLGEAALAYTVREVDQLKHPEAHYLVEELMIRANTQVARKLSRELGNNTILRSQKPPGEKELKEFAKCYKTALPLSASCKVLFPQQPDPTSPLLMMKSQYEKLRENLQSKKCLEVMHYVQMEHLHPQLVALQSQLRSLQSPADYCVVKEGEYGAHSDLKCSHYTHFTSPLRRYIDVIIQRQLHAALNGKPNEYSVDELNIICQSTQKMLKKAKEYERDIESSMLVKSLQVSQRVYDCIISKMDIKERTLSLCFTDVELDLGPKAREITTHQLNRNHSKVPSATSIPYEWKVKLCSMNGTPASFLDPSQVQISTTQESDSHLSFYVQLYDENNCIEKKQVNIKVRSNVASIPPKIWKMLQQCATEGQASIAAHSEEILYNLAPYEENHSPIPHMGWRSILLVYTLSRELKFFDVMKAQLCATQAKNGLVKEPAVQLLEVGPGLQLCIHHNKDPEKCFVGRLTQHASKERYGSLKEYVSCWEPLILSESALTSVKESELLFIRDADFKWPGFMHCVSSSGDSYYTMNDDAEKDGVELTLPIEFMQSSYNFFKMSEGDLVCIRLTSRDGLTKYVFHMVISNVTSTDDTAPAPIAAKVYMKFVLRKANYFSPQVHKAITEGNASYEIQLIHSSLPQRYIIQKIEMQFNFFLQEDISVFVGNRQRDTTCQSYCNWVS